jgi:hypothetical protein
MRKHQTKQCREAQKKSDPKRGAVQTWFTPISDVEEIRQVVGINLPQICKCNLCGFELEAPTQSDVMKHLTENHEMELYELR